MKRISTRSRLARNGLVILSLLAMQLAMTVAPAGAAKPTVIAEDNTGFACDYFPEGGPQVSVSINFDDESGEGYSSAQVLGPDGEAHLARGFTDEVIVRDGVVSARYPLFHTDGSEAGDVILEGTYAPASETLTLRNRFPYARNAQIIGTLTYTELDVTWTTFQVGGYDVSGISCFGQHSETLNRVLQPTRLVGTFPEVRLLENCATPPLTGFSVEPSEAGVTLALTLDGYSGFTNVALDDGSDTQPVYWYTEGGEQPADVTGVSVARTESGHRRSEVNATPDGLILEQIQPVSLSYHLDLPAGMGTVSGQCAAESVIVRTAVEPVE
jgi:hypothetical protein